MKKVYATAIATLSLVAVILGGAIVEAGGWDNFKLRYFRLTAALHDQERELADIQKQNLDPQENSRIVLAELLNGGPPKDGIPSIDNPQFDTPETTPFSDEEIVVGVIVNGEAKAYPYGILNWHEIVNDMVGGVNVSVSYCPLCDTIVAFRRGETTFGVSGKLYQSCLVMYDRADDTLYSQPWAMGIVGKQVNGSLERLPAVKTTLGAWIDRHPDSQILSPETGYNRDYFRYPYGRYTRDKNIIFPVRNQERLQEHPKAIVSYIWQGDERTPHNRFSGDALQFSHDRMRELGEKVVEFGGRQVRARWDENLDTVVVEEMDGTPIVSSTAFAFVYPAYFED